MRLRSWTCMHCTYTHLGGVLPPPGWTAIGGRTVCASRACDVKERAAIQVRREAWQAEQVS